MHSISSSRVVLPLLTAVVLTAMVLSSSAQVQTAGTLFVKADATASALGPISALTNTGTLGGFLSARGGGVTVPRVAIIGTSGTRAIQFDGDDFMQLVATIGGAVIAPPAGLVGLDPTRTIEVWAYNPALADEETMVSMGKRGGPAGSNLSFNYGANALFGAIGHWDTPDIGWSNAGGAPAANAWHHLVYTYDGTTTRVYADGVLQNSEVLGLGVINTAAGTAISLATQLEADGVTATAGLRGSLSLARVRIHDGVLSPAQVSANYAFELPDFLPPVPVPLAAGPSHLYSFNSPPASDAAGTTIPDALGAAPGTVRGAGGTATGTRLVLAGGASSTAAYGDLPNGLLSSLSTDNGGSGEVTFETWARVTGARTNSHLFDFGSTTGGELAGPGGGGAVVDSFTHYATLGGSNTARRVEVRNSDTPPNGTNEIDFLTATFDALTHVVVTWKESSGDVRIFENGVTVVAFNTAQRFSRINDVNNWLGRANNTADQNTQVEFDEFRIYPRVLSPGEVLGNQQTGPGLLNLTGAGAIYESPASQNVLENLPVTLSVGASGTLPLAYQWYRAGVPLAGVTGASYTFAPATADHGVSFTCVVSNFPSGVPSTAASSAAVLSVTPDVTPPVLARATSLATNIVRAEFNEILLAASVGALTNYALTGPGGAVAIASATLDPTGTNVLLLTVLLLQGSNYTLVVHGVRDNTAAQNPLAADSTVMFRAETRPRLGRSFMSHRWSLSEAASSSTAGAIFLDSIGTAHGVVRGNGAIFTGSRLGLPGGSSTSAVYGDLPNGLISNVSTNRGGPGAWTIQVWMKVTGNQAWSRVIDFGSTTGGELAGPGGGGGGLDYLLLSAQIGANTASRRFAWRDGEPAANAELTRDFTTAAFNEDFVTTVTWNERTGEIVLYEGNTRIATINVTSPMTVINDVNNWIGRSNYSADSNTQGEYDEVRLYDGVLAAADINAAIAYGPDRLPSSGPAQIIVPPLGQTVTELLPATFRVTVGGFPVPGLQWHRDGAAIPGATNESYTLASAALTDSGAQFHVTAMNLSGGVPFTAMSIPATLTVAPDTNGPVLVSAVGLTLNSLTVVDGVQVQFDEGLLAGPATMTGNFALTGPGGAVALTAATLDGSGRFVTLATAAPLTEGASYTVTVNQVKDLAAAANTIAPDSQIRFVAQAFVLRTVGTVSASNSVTAVPGGFEVSAAGRDIGATGDDFSYHSQIRSGDFDVRVRVSSLGLGDGYSEVGWMARADTGPGAAFAAVMAGPSLGGVRFQSRASAGAAASAVGSMPVNYPCTWLRLERVGQTFTGYGSLDGLTWLRLGSATLDLPLQVFLGFAVSSHNPAAAIQTQLRDVALGTGGTVVTTLALPFEPPGPSSRRTGLTFSEIMYHPADGAGVSLEFIEICNGQDYFEDLSGFSLAGDADYTFPPGTKIESGGYLVIARDPAALQTAYGLAGVLGPLRTNLPNTRGTVRLLNENGGHLLDVNYDSAGAWPAAADGAGHSLVLARPSYGEGSVQAWTPSQVTGGSPGRAETWKPEPQHAVVINEFLAHTDFPALDFVELFNTSTQAVDIGGCWLSDDFGTNKFRVPDGTVLPGRGFKAWNETQLGFSLSSDGEEILLVNSNQTRVLEAVRFGGQAKGVSRGRSPDGAPYSFELGQPTFGSNNAPCLRRDIVISEIMYHPISGRDDDEFIELHNRGTTNVNVGGWRFIDGVNFTLPVGTIISAGGHLVVARNRTNLLARHPNLLANPALVVGDYGGALDDGGEHVALALPEFSIRTNGTTVTTNVSYVGVNDLTYGDGGRWGAQVDGHSVADGGGSSLELIDANADNQLAAHWADSDETQKAPWTLIERTAVADLGMTAANGTPNRLEVFLQGAGECLLDEVECRSNGGTNRVTDPGFELGPGAWFFQGTHRRTFIQGGGAFAGNNCLHVLALERGDAGANRIRTAMASVVTGGTNTVTLRARARWLQGDTNILLRLRGQWMECAGALTVPTNLGTPGAPNSRRLLNAGPAIFEVAHAPVLPAAGEPVVVTARASDPQGVAAVILHYRLDPSASLTAVMMHDDGTAGDATAGDGIHSGTIPGQAAGTLVAFQLEARDPTWGMDRLDAAEATLFPVGAPGHECLVRFGETLRPGSIGTYRMWLTASNITAWNNRERNSNEGLDCTFVYGNWRVIYGTQTLYSGSPFHTANQPYTGPLGPTTCDYELLVPPDDPFAGTTEFVLNAQAQSTTFFDNDTSAQAETTAYWLGRRLGLQFNYKRHVFVVMNGEPRAMIYFDHQQPNQQIVDEYFPNDPDGRLHKIEDWFEFDDAGNGFNYLTSTLQNYLVAGQKRPERYRFTWRPRAGAHPNDFADLFSLVDAVNATSPEPRTSAILGLADLRNWMRVWAVQHTIGNWDTWGYRRGKNMFAYKPGRGPWKLLLWDLDLVLGKGSDGTGQAIFDTSGADGDPVVAAMYTHPPFVREFWCALRELVDGPMVPANYNPSVDARFAAFRANDVPVDTADAMKAWIDARRAFILPQIPVAGFSITATNVSASSNVMILSGTAPVTAKDILVHGAEYPITWTTVSNWTLRVPLAAGTNTLVVSAADRNGTEISNRTVVVNYTGPTAEPEGGVVLNEVLFNPAAPDTEFVELFNPRTNVAFDLSGWRCSGLGYTFPAGASIAPRTFLVLAKDRYAYGKTFGATRPVFDEFSGSLDRDGETLTLLRPGAAPGTEVVVDKVKYEARAPWPGTAAITGSGSALQLVDATQDNARVSNWSDGAGWRFASLTGFLQTNSTNVILFSSGSGGDVYLDDISLVAGPVPAVGTNLLANGDFESPLSGPWSIIGTNHTNSALAANVAHGGAASLRLVSTGPGSQVQCLRQIITPPAVSNQFTVSFWYLSSTNGTNVQIRSISGAGITFSVNFRPPARATPGTTNSVVAPVAPYPFVWLNEVVPVNTTGLTDAQNEPEPWIELFNSSTSPIPLDGYTLSDNYLNLGLWSFPTGAVLNPGEFKVIFADGETGESTMTEWHTSFRLSGGTGTLALSQNTGVGSRIVDYFNYENVPTNRGYGSCPDGQLFDRQELFHLTPGASNHCASAPLFVYINEWMAANTGFIRDPADNNADDWFELFNPNAVPVDLGGYYLSDALTNLTQYQVPANGHHVIPPSGYLLVWADGETGQNSTNRADLHVNFQLRAAAEAIALSAPDGTLLDSVSFTNQMNNISEGRYPDGTGPIATLPLATPRGANSNPNPSGPPEILEITYNAGLVTLQVATVPGRRYRVEYKAELGDLMWTPLEPDQTAAGPVTTFVDHTSGAPQRFYQAVLLP